MDPIETLARLVAIPSVNPMGREVLDLGPPYYETRLTEYLEQVCRRMGLRVVRQPVAPGRENLLARLDGQMPPEQGGRLILLDVHQDTVPVEGMTIEPFTPEIRDGRLYGRGSCDVKGGMAAMLAAVARLAAERPPGMPTVVLSCTVNEENGFSGARALTELWSGPAGEIFPRRPDAAIVAEPTGLDVVVAHKGMVRWRCHTLGRAAHSSQPEAGENAIYRMARLLTVLERYARTVLGRTSAGRQDLGPATLSVGTIQGGTSVNTVPDRCSIEIDRRLLPGERAEEARRQVIDYVAAATEVDFPIEHDPSYAQGPALSDDANRELAERLAMVAAEVTGGCRQRGVRYGTNAALFAAAGVPSVIFGPGNIEQAHTQDEWISLEQVRLAAEIYFDLMETP